MRSIYKTPALKEVTVRTSFCATSPYGDAGMAGNYDSSNDIINEEDY